MPYAFWQSPPTDWAHLWTWFFSFLLKHAYVCLCIMLCQGLQGSNFQFLFFSEACSFMLFFFWWIKGQLLVTDHVQTKNNNRKNNNKKQQQHVTRLTNLHCFILVVISERFFMVCNYSHTSLISTGKVYIHQFVASWPKAFLNHTAKLSACLITSWVCQTPGKDLTCDGAFTFLLYLPGTVDTQLLVTFWPP